jgi:hypothetical protein
MTAQTAEDSVAKLCRVLRAENKALAVMDIASANTLLAEKITATDTLIEALKSRPNLPESARADVMSLQALAAENKALLERAMLAQRRVLACIARAVPRALAQDTNYSAGGKTRPPARMPPITLSSEA